MLSTGRAVAPFGSAARDRRTAGRYAVLVPGLFAALAAVAFPFLPVQQPRVDYAWTASDGAAAIPLMPYQPVALTATIECDTARTTGMLLSTVPPRPDPAAVPLAGLRLTSATGSDPTGTDPTGTDPTGSTPAGADGTSSGSTGRSDTGTAGPGRSGDATTDRTVTITSGGVELGAVALPAGRCSLSVASDPQRTVVRVDGETVLVHEGDVRPAVAGAFSYASSGVELALTADTRFQTTISPLKATVGVIAVLALLGMFVALRRADRAATARVRLLPQQWWRPRGVDVAVVALLGVWWLIGAITVDDGYIAGIVRSRGENGLVGNVYRWLNAPEAPFSWFYDLYHLWSLISSSTLWMRLPSTLLGLLTWALLSRLVLPRLGAAAHRPWVAALAFGTWWVPFNLGLRPEPWVAVGVLGVFLAVERAVATRRLVPLAVGLVLAGATTAVTPGGLIAFTPLLAASVPVLRLLRARRDLGWWAVLAAVGAAPASAVLLMTYDQSLAGVLEATRVRALIGGGVQWYQEAQRYGLLLEPGSFQGSIGRRAAVLVTVLAAAGALLRRPSGIARGPARRLVLSLLLALGVMTFTPTKWTQHFGDLAGLGAAVLVVGAAAWSAAALRGRLPTFLAGAGAAVAVAALVLAGYNTWPYASGWFVPAFSTVAPQLFDIPLATILLAVGATVVGGLLARTAWRRAAGAPVGDVPRRMPGPVPVLATLLVVVLGLQVLGLGRVALEHRDSYTLASDSLATLRGEPCGLQPLLSVETDPVAGLLPSRTVPAVPTERPVDVGGRTLPGIAVAGTVTTAWFAIDAAALTATPPGAGPPSGRLGESGAALPVVVTTSGRTRAGDLLAVEFGDATGTVLDRQPITADSDEPRDVRRVAPPGAKSVRLVVDATAGTPALVTLPRVPRLTPMAQLLPPGSTAILDWPVAFLFPCLTPEPLALGTAGLAPWRIGTPAGDPAAGITYSPGFGGSFAAPRLLVTEQRMATYLAGDPVRDAAQLYRWTPVQELARPDPIVTGRSVPGWERDGRASVPGLDPVG